MATVIGLGVQFSANASGMTKGLSQVDRQLQNLGKQAGQAARLFDTFASSSAAASAAQQQVATDVAFLGSALRTGQVTAEQYAAELQAIVGSAQQQAAAFAEGARITEQVATAEERRAATLERLGQLLATGAINEETYSRAAAEASGENEAAAKAETDRAAALARAAQITQANLSPQQKYDQQVQELSGHLAAGRITQETYSSALNKAATDFAKATIAANKYDASVEAAGDGGTLKFNELSGALAAIPGPIGNVAGRLSGLTSAGEGLGRVFSGGLTQGLAGIGTSVAGLINPFTAGLAAVAAFGAGASAVANGLLALDERVEQLGNLADQLGVSFEFIQVLEESANRSGVSVDTLAGSMTRLQKTLAGADEESKSAQSALDRLGVSVEDLNGLSQQDQIRLIGDRLGAIQDPAQRTAAAVALFGKSGAALLPFFKNLGPAASDLERFGKVLNDIDRGRIEDFGDGVDALRVASKGLSTDLLLPFAGLGEGIAQGSAEFLGGVNAIVGPIGDVLEPVLSSLGSALETVGVVVGGVGRVFGTLLAPIGEISQAFGVVGDSFNEAFVDVVRYLVDGAVSAAEFVQSFNPLGVIADNIGAIGETVSRVTNIIGTAFSQAATFVGDLAAGFVEFTGIGPALEAIGETVSGVFNSISQTLSSVASGIGEYLGSWLTAAEEWLGIRAELETPIAAELDVTQPLLAATQFSDAIGQAAIAASEFGQAGFEAALAYQTGLEQIAQLQADNTLTADEAKKAAEQEKAAFEAKIETLESEADAQRKSAEAAQKAADQKIEAAQRAADAQIDADRRLADSFIASQGIGAQDDRARAQETLLAITRQIDETETAIVEARAAGDAQAEASATRRLAILDQAQAAAQQTVELGFSTQDAQNAIADVRADLDETFSFDNFQIAPEAFSAAQEQLAQLEQDLLSGAIDPETFEQAADAIRSGFEDALATAQEIAQLNERYAEQSAEIERERLANLARTGPTTVQASDLRTSEGASQFLRLATGQQDPAIEEYRKQLSKLDEIRREIAKVGGTVEIVGA
jgi:hypothetical protein